MVRRVRVGGIADAAVSLMKGTCLEAASVRRALVQVFEVGFVSRLMERGTWGSLCEPDDGLWTL